MRDLDYMNSYEHLRNELFNNNDVTDISIIVNKKRLKKQINQNVLKITNQPTVTFQLSVFIKSTKEINRNLSMPEINKNTLQKQPRLRSGHAMKTQQKSPFESKFIINVVSEHRFDECLNPFNYPFQTNWKIYRCQLNAREDTCCCSCNSDAMFEVMKSLYDCYKKKNCDNCDCILCGHRQKEERELGELRKSLAAVGLDTTSTKERKAETGTPLGIPSEKLRKARAAGIMTPLEGKTPEQKDKILKGLANHGLLLPEGKTPSEKKLIDKIRVDLGLPPEPKTKSMKDKHIQAANAGLLVPLEGKSPKEKERILQGLHDIGIPLPEGRSPSEKALVAKVKARPRKPSVVSKYSERMRKAKVDGLLTPIEGKPPEQREKILRGLAMRGIPLPEGQTPSDKKLIEKVRTDLGLPIEPKNKAIRDKHQKAALAGKLFPLEGKSPAQKESILRGLHDMAIPLPIGRTPSEKALIAKILAGPPPSAVPQAKSERLKEVASKYSERMKKAKLDGLLTPLESKTPEQREKILKGLAMRGIPLPEGQTPSDKKLIEKVRTDLGLPIEPKNKAIRDKHQKAALAGKLFPLEGKSPAQKESILRGLHDMAIPLPIGRTPSEKALIAKILAGPPPSAVPQAKSERLKEVASKYSERMKKAKLDGLLTPLENKTPEQREKILRGLAMRGIPLPEGQTPSDKKLIDKVRTDLGLPVEPKNKAIRDKHQKAALAGILFPLEGKSPAQKESILRGLHDMAIPLPIGRTPSEKALIAKIVAGPPPSAVSQTKSERLKAAKAAGFLTPLEGKKPEQKEKILRGLAKNGIPLPEGKTPSEKKLVDKVRAEVGLPPVPQTPSIKEKYAKAQAAGLITPLDGKTSAQKEKILRAQAAMGLPLPEGRTPSEKALIAQVKAEPTPSITTEKLRKAKAAGLLTPLAGKPTKQKEKILKGLAKAGMPLPEGRTPSEKALINKVRKELGLPDRTASEKIRRARATGLLTPLEGKTPAQKEKILRGRVAAGLPLPIGKSPSERALIQKIKADTGYVTPSPSERLRKAKAAGMITPLKGKTPSVKEKILKNMIAAGVPIPEGETPSEKDLISKLIAEPPPLKKTQSEKMKQAAGVMTPLQGKTHDQKQKILRSMVKAGVPLPEPKTATEAKLIDKIREDLGLPPEPKTPSLQEKYRKAQAAGLITPLEGKTPAEQAKVLQKLREAGLPLPEGKTPSQKALIKKIQEKPLRKTPSEKLKAAKAAGFLTPLEGKTNAQKENILKGLAKTGVLLPEGKTPSEKNLINKVRQEMGLPPEPKTPSMREKMQKAQAAGIITPLEGKTAAKKKKILQALADAGIPLPEGRTPSEKSLIAKTKPKEGKAPTEKEKTSPEAKAKTPSEKSLIQKIKTDLGIAPKTPSEKSIIRKAKEAGLLTPITGKAPAEKERILKGLAEVGLPLPVGKTASEKDLIKKIRADAGLASEPTSSEKMGKIRKKMKKGDVSASKKLGKGIEAEEFENVIKKTTCDRGCGCDKKKIRFKHSYVKIRVTSPDISSFCDCPLECIPGVISGAFVDNEGIKVTVGRVIGIPLYSQVYSSHDGKRKAKQISTRANFLNNQDKSQYKVCTFDTDATKEVEYAINSSSDSSPRPYSTDSENIFEHICTPACEGWCSKSIRILRSSRDLQSSVDMLRAGTLKTKSNASSFDSILVIKSETSLSLNSSPSNSDTISVVSDINSSISCNSTHYSGDQSTDDLVTLSSLDCSMTSESEDNNEHRTTPIRTGNVKKKLVPPTPQQVITVYRMSQTKINFQSTESRKTKKKTEADEPVILLNHLPTKLALSKLTDKILKKKQYADVSSIFIVIPTSDEDTGNSVESSEKSNASYKSTRTYVLDKNKNLNSGTLKTSASTNRKVKVCGKGKKFYMKEVLSSDDKETMFQKETLQILRHVEMTKNQLCQIAATREMKKNQFCQIASASEMTKNQFCQIASASEMTKNQFCQIAATREMTKNQFCQIASASEMTKNQFCQISAASEMLQVVEKIDQIVGTDIPMNTPCCCCAKDSYNSLVYKCSSKGSYVTNVMSRQITPVFFKGKSLDWFHLTGLSKKSVEPYSCDIPPCSSCDVPSNPSCQHIHHHRHSHKHLEPTSGLKQRCRTETPPRCGCISAIKKSRRPHISFASMTAPRKKATAPQSLSHRTMATDSKNSDGSTAHKKAGHRRYDSSNAFSTKSVHEVKFDYCDKKKTSTTEQNKKGCACKGYPILETGSTSTESIISVKLSSPNYSRQNQLPRQRRYPPANRQSKRPEDTIQPFSNKENFGDDPDQKKKRMSKKSKDNAATDDTDNKVDRAIQVVDGQEIEKPVKDLPPGKSEQADDQVSQNKKSQKSQKSPENTISPKTSPKLLKFFSKLSKSSSNSKDSQKASDIMLPICGCNGEKSSNKKNAKSKKKSMTITDPKPEQGPLPVQVPEAQPLTDTENLSPEKSSDIMAPICGCNGEKKSNKMNATSMKKSMTKIDPKPEQGLLPAQVPEAQPLTDTENLSSEKSSDIMAPICGCNGEKKSNKMNATSMKKSMTKIDPKPEQGLLPAQVPEAQPLTDTENLSSEKSSDIMAPICRCNGEKKSNKKNATSMRKSMTIIDPKSEQRPLPVQAPEAQPLTGTEYLCPEKTSDIMPPICGCNGDIKTNMNKTKSKKKSMTIIDPTSQICPCPLPEKQTFPGAQKTKSDSSSAQSKKKSMTITDPKSEQGLLPAQVPQAQPLTDTENLSSEKSSDMMPPICGCNGDIKSNMNKTKSKKKSMTIVDSTSQICPCPLPEKQTFPGAQKTKFDSSSAPLKATPSTSKYKQIPQLPPMSVIQPQPLSATVPQPMSASKRYVHPQLTSGSDTDNTPQTQPFSSSEETPQPQPLNNTEQFSKQNPQSIPTSETESSPQSSPISKRKLLPQPVPIPPTHAPGLPITEQNPKSVPTSEMESSPQSVPTSETESSPQSTPMSERKLLPQRLPIPPPPVPGLRITEQNPQSLPTSEMESSPQSVPTSETESSPQSTPISERKLLPEPLPIPPPPAPYLPFTEQNPQSVLTSEMESSPQSVPTSETESSPQSTPISERKLLPQPLPIPPPPAPGLPITEQNPQSVPTSETESSPQSTPISESKLPQPEPIPPPPAPGLPIPQNDLNETKQPQQLLLPPQYNNIMQPAADPLPPEGYPYDESGPSCGWVDKAEVSRLKSEWSQFTSGFKACKRKKIPNVVKKEKLDVPQEEIELDFEDAVKYYASMHPELFRDLMQQELQKKIESETDVELFKGKEGKKLKKKREKERKQREKARNQAEKGKIKKAKKKGKSSSDSDEEDKKKNPLDEERCGCPYGPIPPPITYETTSESPEELERYPRGLKMSLGAKGSARLGLKGVACFKMTRESQSSSTICNQESLISW